MRMHQPSDIPPPTFLSDFIKKARPIGTEKKFSVFLFLAKQEFIESLDKSDELNIYSGMGNKLRIHAHYKDVYCEVKKYGPAHQLAIFDFYHQKMIITTSANKNDLEYVELPLNHFIKQRLYNDYRIGEPQ